MFSQDRWVEPAKGKTTGSKLNDGVLDIENDGTHEELVFSYVLIYANHVNFTRAEDRLLREARSRDHKIRGTQR